MTDSPQLPEGSCCPIEHRRLAFMMGLSNPCFHDINDLLEWVPPVITIEQADGAIRRLNLALMTWETCPFDVNDPPLAFYMTFGHTLINLHRELGGHDPLKVIDAAIDLTLRQ